jgi:hypothetical protein
MLFILPYIPILSTSLIFVGPAAIIASIFWSKFYPEYNIAIVPGPTSSDTIDDPAILTSSDASLAGVYLPRLNIDRLPVFE